MCGVILAENRAELSLALADLPGTRALVMTMGALHAGHTALLEEAGRQADHVIVSVYVNPLQFGPGEDYATYPRDLAADLALLEEAGADLVFAPSDEEMYPGWPQRPAVRVDPGPLAQAFEGAARPGHFAGVAQVVAKVVNLVRPHVSVFGQKDAQQLALVRSLVRDLGLPGRVVGVPISRDEDGLARSSRNAYLSPLERERALTLSRALRAGVAAAAQPAATPRAVVAAARDVLETAPRGAPAGVPLEVDYLALVDATTFAPLGEEDPGEPADQATDAGRDAVLVLAARVGTTRLIDNTPIHL